jgi:hypothetical protein
MVVVRSALKNRFWIGMDPIWKGRNQQIQYEECYIGIGITPKTQLCCKSIFSPLTAKSYYKPLLLRPLQRPQICRDLCRRCSSNATRQPFTVFFFLQPHGFLFPLPCTKAAAHDVSKLKHLHPSGWFHCIFRITFITSMYSEMGSL